MPSARSLFHCVQKKFFANARPEVRRRYPQLFDLDLIGSEAIKTQEPARLFGYIDLIAANEGG